MFVGLLVGRPIHEISLQGYTEITIAPASSELRTIILHCRQSGACSYPYILRHETSRCASLTVVHSVHVGAYAAEFVHNDPFVNLINGISEPDCHRHPELKRKLYSALQEGDEGELSIAIPKEVSLKPTGSVNQILNDCESYPSLVVNDADHRVKFPLLSLRLNLINKSRNFHQL